VRSAESLDAAGVPTLLRPPGRAGTAPLVVLWHGFARPGREREALADALPLSGLSAWKAYPSLPLFGPRAPAGGLEELARRQREDYLLRLVGPVVEGATRELAPLVAELARLRPVDVRHGIGLVGFSAGGAAVLLSLFESDVSVRAAVLLGAPASAMSGVAAVERALGTPYAWSEQSRALASRLDFVRRAEELARRPALPAPDDAEGRALPSPPDDIVTDWLRRHLGTADHTSSGAPAT
jgi:pimeloyl-ACP methyl ester carboxylesterase